jgi:competence protein ComEC
METEKWGTAKFLNDWLNENGLGIKTLGKNLNISDKAKIEILWPDKKICQDETLGDNDKSTVSLIVFGGSAQHAFRRKILLCADIERFAQQKILELFPNLKADVVVVPHHGTVKTIESGFLESLDADISICSCGLTQYERLQTIKPKDQTKSFYTARDDAITICVDKNGSIRTTTFTKIR